MKNLSGAFGYLLVGLFVYLAVTKGTVNPQVFLNYHGLLIVAGGLVVAALASFPFSVLMDSAKSVYKSMFSSSKVSAFVADDLVQLSAAYQKSMSAVETQSEKIKSPFLLQSVNLILEGIPATTVIEILNKRIEEHRISVQNKMNVMLTLSKYSPALGLAATVLGLIDLLSQLQEADMVKLGYGMAIALSATFYGIVLSNLVYAPLSEMIASVGEIETKEMEMVSAGLQGLLEKKHPLIVGEIVNSYLDDSQKINFYEQSKSTKLDQQLAA
jgi:chemotaxis protein MotA